MEPTTVQVLATSALVSAIVSAFVANGVDWLTGTRRESRSNRVLAQRRAARELRTTVNELDYYFAQAARYARVEDAPDYLTRDRFDTIVEEVLERNAALEKALAAARVSAVIGSSRSDLRLAPWKLPALFETTAAIHAWHDHVILRISSDATGEQRVDALDRLLAFEPVFYVLLNVVHLRWWQFRRRESFRDACARIGEIIDACASRVRPMPTDLPSRDQGHPGTSSGRRDGRRR